MMFENLETISGRAEFTPRWSTTEKIMRRPGKRSTDAPTTVVIRKVRVLNEPNDVMKAKHAELVRGLRQLWPLQGPTPWVTGALPGSSPVKNVLQHAGKRFILTIDLRDAYDNVEPERLIDIVAADYVVAQGALFGTGRERLFIENIIGDYCACFGGRGLRTGAPASPDLFNRYALELIDRPILRLQRRYDFTYTRYLDDLTFSWHRPFPAELRKVFREIIFAAGFQISWRKAGNIDLEQLGTTHLNGIGLRANGQLFVPRRYLRKVTGLVTVAHHSSGYGAHLTPEIVMGHVGVVKHIFAHQVGLFTTGELRFIDRVNAYRRSLGLRPLKF